MNLGHRLKLKPRYIWIEFVTQDMDGVGLSFALNIRFHRFHSTNSTNQFRPCNTWGAETAQYSGDSGAKQFLSRQSYDLVIVISRTSYATQSFMMFHVRSAGLHQSFGPCNVHGTSSCFKSGVERFWDDSIVGNWQAVVIFSRLIPWEKSVCYPFVNKTKVRCWLSTFRSGCTCHFFEDIGQFVRLFCC